ncbi:hypothetical protein METBIDRAFT_104275 [Metschnikowia bicuspidata var. bicuspidata NRRL YB-4993]|uniref:EamA domain-containing protein n=1 Tax=Metschnikowia bicuspidata var. bicuspidata NRRL YB-4993 TaxID=869754 RepID=A0A1A0HHI7_9ASCO|nr:hypothetical protein METBIDRAFT_104275 [Metschnikowia bicuspidata var. bicuspidata NRRL YB-4993]OBA23342.1 hypothetical protein METBIDRAFT_104275 [Metschnikowia bicuspidata var. bicuspidata NRRL YB-4993]
MAITELNARSETSEETSTGTSHAKIVFIASLFVVSLATFICQTEFTSQAYLVGFKEPVILLLVTHGSWWLLWPLQALFTSLWRTYLKYRDSKSNQRYERLDSSAFLLEHEAPLQSTAQSDREPPTPAMGLEIVETRPLNIWKYFKKCLVKQVHNVYHTSILVYEAQVNDDRLTHNLQRLIDRNTHISSTSSLSACIKSLIQTPAFRYIAAKTAIISVVLNLAGFTWYGAMSMTYASDVTAIYNCSAFTAYAFAIPLLNEKFSWLKAASVIIAVSGVFVVAYSGAESTESETQYPYRLLGNVIISVGAVLYGYYEVLYKKYACVPDHLAKVITPRRQLTFSNFVMALLGMFTLTFLLLGILLVELLQIHHFNLFNYGKNTTKIWAYIGGSIISNLLFSGLFLSLMALTSPVLSSVSSLVTIFLIGIVEWILFGNELGFMQLLGDALVIVGFAILTAASWKEISEGNEDDEIDAASYYSFAPSVNTVNHSERG